MDPLAPLPPDEFERMHELDHVGDVFHGLTRAELKKVIDTEVAKLREAYDRAVAASPPVRPEPSGEPPPETPPESSGVIATRPAAPAAASRAGTGRGTPARRR